MDGVHAVKSDKARLNFWLCHLLDTWPWTRDTTIVTHLLKSHRHVTKWEIKSVHKNIVLYFYWFPYPASLMLATELNLLSETGSPLFLIHVVYLSGTDPKAHLQRWAQEGRPLYSESTLWFSNGRGPQAYFFRSSPVTAAAKLLQ